MLATLATDRPEEFFEWWRPRVTAWLAPVAVLLASYWIAWFGVRDLVASEHTPGYVGFEQAFVLADACLMAAVTIAAVQLWRRRPRMEVEALAGRGVSGRLCYGWRRSPSK